MSMKFILASAAVLGVAVGASIAEARNIGVTGTAGSHISSGMSHSGRASGHVSVSPRATFKSGGISNRPATRRSFSSRSGPSVGFNEGRYHHRHHGSRIVIGAPYYYGDDYGGYSRNCDWLYRKAIATGSDYWWQRYQVCRG
jgi:hypothetical protein